MLSGRVRSRITGRSTALTMPSTSAASIAPAKPATRTPGTISAVRYRATAVISQLISTPISCHYSRAAGGRISGAARGGNAAPLQARAHEGGDFADELRHGHPRGLERRDLVLGGPFRPGDDRAGVAHPLA